MSAPISRHKDGTVTVLVNPSSTGNTAVVAAAGAGIKIRVVSMALVSTLANGVKFQSGTTDISPLWPLGANGGMVLPPNNAGWFSTAANEALNINMSAATATGVLINYKLSQV